MINGIPGTYKNKVFKSHQVMAGNLTAHQKLSSEILSQEQSLQQLPNKQSNGMKTWKQQWSLTVELLRAKCWARCFISIVPFNPSSVVETTLTPILQLRKLKIREIKLLLFPGPLSWLVAEMELEPMDL